jgi:hypothetical protein
MKRKRSCSASFYDAAGQKIGVANVETTRLAILGLEECRFQ